MDESERVPDTGEMDSGTQEHEASIIEVLQKSEEWIRLEKRKLNKEKMAIEQQKEGLLREKDELGKLKDEVLAEKEQTIKAREQLYESKDQLAVQRQKATKLIGRLEEQHINFKHGIDDVNRKIKEVEKRTRELVEREKLLLKTAEEQNAKRTELIKWEKEIIQKEKDTAERSKAINTRETELREMEKAIAERERDVNKTEQVRLVRERELDLRLSQILAKERAIQEDYEKHVTMKAELLERENNLSGNDRILEEGGSFDPIEPVQTEMEELDLNIVEADLGLNEDIQVKPEIEPEEEAPPAPVAAPEDIVEQSAPQTEVETPSAEDEGMDEDIEGERPCPRCSTMISKIATTCFACGADLLPETTSFETATGPSAEDLKDTPAESEFLEFEKKERGEVRVPSKEELYTLDENQLIAICRSLGLDSSGRIKHLRERLAKYIDSMEEQQKKGGVVESEDGEPEGAGAPNCPDCGSAMNYIEQYDRHYCYSCEKYAPRSKST